MYQNNNTDQKIIHDVESVVQKQDEVEFKKNSQMKSVKGKIVNVTNSEVISVKNYHGNGIDRINAKSDVYKMNSERLDILCNSAQYISNRVILDFEDGRKVEIGGCLKSAKANSD